MCGTFEVTLKMRKDILQAIERTALRAQNKEVCNEDMNWEFIFVCDHHFSYQHGRDRLRKK